MKALFLMGIYRFRGFNQDEDYNFVQPLQHFYIDKLLPYDFIVYTAVLIDFLFIVLMCVGSVD